jgi:hypothetical protein
MSEKELIKQIRKGFLLKPNKRRRTLSNFFPKSISENLRNWTLPRKKSILENSFRGVWKDRDDLQDSTKWVRELRKSRWEK